MSTTALAPATGTVAPVVRAVIPGLGQGATQGWRRLLTSVTATATGARDLEGPWLDANATVDLPPGALVLAVDRYPDRWEITAHRADTHGLAAIAAWTRRSPLGRREATRLRALLTEASPRHTARTLIAPNRDDSTCNTCQSAVPAGLGWIHHTPTGPVPVCASCPPRPRANHRPGRCARCGGWVAAREGTVVLVGAPAPARGAGRHRPLHTVCPQDPKPGPPLTADAWCTDCRTLVPAGTGYWKSGPHHSPGDCTQPDDGLPRWILHVPAGEPAWKTGSVRRIRHTPRPGEPLLPPDMPGGRILTDTGLMTVLGHVLDLRTTAKGRTLALVRAATWIEAAPLLGEELEAALTARPDGGTFLAREVIERIHGDRGWVAEITGHDPRHGLARTFLTSQTDYDEADRRGHSGVMDAWTMRPRRIYEVSRPVGPPARNWRDLRRLHGQRTRVTEEKRYFARVNADGDIVRISMEEVEAWLSVALEWMS
ncbi:hypothetical protein [Streptomyces sp. NPDC056056]|uniref:hypothetical protein n=1 Tax=Streptomyces sp. NPDC056056 TaxID=3345698 RepID=UPI0035E2A152